MASVLPLIVAALAWSAPPGFSLIAVGPAGGTVWQGAIPGRFAPPDRLPSLVYLPPNASRRGHYRVAVLLHRFRGSPYAFVDSLELASVADRLIAAQRVAPFVAVMPRGGSPGYRGEWVGRWELYVAQEVVPWIDRSLPVRRDRAAWMLGGFSAGGYGAVDIGLRHPRLFGTLESWSGYYHPFRDGSLRHARPAQLAAHDPMLLTKREAPLLRSLGTRFFVSCGSTHDLGNAVLALAFAVRLSALRLPHLLWLRPGGHDGAFWRAQLPEALLFGLTRPVGSPRAPWTGSSRTPTTRSTSSSKDGGRWRWRASRSSSARATQSSSRRVPSTASPRTSS